MKQPKAPARPPRPVRLMPVEDALGMLSDYWPQLFSPELPLRLMKTGIREEMVVDITARRLPVSVI
ncbi:hypothetical protein LRN22_004158 [Salmonella enterica]|nr:hypothetical protein [Salmonella enterica]